jgi:hypothetical protein
MALPARFSPLHSDLNDFLFASVGVEQNGMPLSVVSALTRLGADPWEEAARLAALPKALAVETLAPMIARLPIGSTAPVGQPGRHPAVGGPFAGTRADDLAGSGAGWYEGQEIFFRGDVARLPCPRRGSSLRHTVNPHPTYRVLLTGKKSMKYLVPPIVIPILLLIGVAAYGLLGPPIIATVAIPSAAEVNAQPR